MTRKTPLLRLLHIVEAIKRIDQYVADSDSPFEDDTLTLDAIERNLERISEASRHIPDDMKADHAHIDWRAMATVGNILRHVYDQVNEKTIREIVEYDLPVLKTATILMIEKFKKENPHA